MSDQIFEEIRAHLLGSGREEVALVFGHSVRSAVPRVTVARWVPVPPEALLVQQQDRFEVSSDFVASNVKEARGRHESVILAHSHPYDRGQPSFSKADGDGEANLYPLLTNRLPGRPHGAMVVSPGGASARLLSGLSGTSAIPAEVRVVGRRVHRYLPQDVVPYGGDPYHSRQELLWGPHSQNLLRNLTVGIVGAGGTGSVVGQQLIHLGVGRIVVVDPDIVEASNLSRVVGARRADVGHTPKVQVLARLAGGVDPGVEVIPRFDSVCTETTARALLDVDLIFLCTDNHYSRAVVNALAVQYLVPLIDMGFWIGLSPDRTSVAAAVGEVRMVVPGGYCLSCAGVLDANQIAFEKATRADRSAFPSYFGNANVPDPSVITVNSMVASLAVMIGLDLFIPTMRTAGAQDYFRFNAIKGSVVNTPRSHQECPICGRDGLGGLADDHPFPE